MDEFSRKFNDLLVDAYKSILRVEEAIIKKSDNTGLSISEIHLIESVGKKTDQPKTISQIANDLNITLPSVTIAVNKLIKKGYLQKTKSAVDARSVFITLTKSGERMNKLHSYFHIKMVHAVADEISDDEKLAMTKGIEKLNAFFKQKLIELED